VTPRFRTQNKNDSEESFFLAFSSLYPLLSFAFSSLLQICGSLSLFSRFQMMLCTLLRIASFFAITSFVCSACHFLANTSLPFLSILMSFVVEYRQRESIACFRSTSLSLISTFHSTSSLNVTPSTRITNSRTSFRKGSLLSRYRSRR